MNKDVKDLKNLLKPFGSFKIRTQGEKWLKLKSIDSELTYNELIGIVEAFEINSGVSVEIDLKD